MQSIRNLLRAAPQMTKMTQMTKAVVPKRNMSVISTFPREKVSRGEIIFLSALMVMGWSAIPIWVLVNIKHYRGEK